MNRLKRYLLSALTIITVALPAAPALPQAASPDQDSPRITKVRASDAKPDSSEAKACSPEASSPEARFGSFIEVEVSDVSKFYQKDQFNASEFMLYLNKHPMPGLSAHVDPICENTIFFNLKPDHNGLDDSKREALRQAWRDVLRYAKPATFLEVGLSYEDKPVRYAGDEPDRQVPFKAYKNWTLMLVLVLLAGIVAAVIYLARRSELLRDYGPPQLSDKKRRPYSLARTQMAFWTVLILGTFGFLYLVTGNYQTLTAQSLTLLGIAATTALASAAIDTRKSSTVNADLNDFKPKKAKLDQELKEIRGRISALQADKQKDPKEGNGELGKLEIDEKEKASKLEGLEKAVKEKESYLTKPASEGFWIDILTDKDGVTLHRLQIVLWTIVLGVFFIWEVWDHLLMPVFSTELLALMGISSGAYLGYKIPEKQSEAEDEEEDKDKEDVSK